MARLGIRCVYWLLMTALALALPPRVAGQTWQVPRTPWGHPDLQGIWSTATITPFERPGRAGRQRVLSPNRKPRNTSAQTVERTNRDRRDRGAETDVARAYNDSGGTAERG